MAVTVLLVVAGCIAGFGSTQPETVAHKIVSEVEHIGDLEVEAVVEFDTAAEADSASEILGRFGNIEVVAELLAKEFQKDSYPDFARSTRFVVVARSVAAEVTQMDLSTVTGAVYFVAAVGIAEEVVFLGKDCSESVVQILVGSVVAAAVAVEKDCCR